MEAYEAAKTFGIFLSHLIGLNPREIKTVIPYFHHLPRRFERFQVAIQNASTERKKLAQPLLESIQQTYTNIEQIDLQTFPLRIVHNDCKISNVLLHRKTGKGVAVIDLDTLMPGSILTDFGDMVRTFCCSQDENHQDLSAIFIQEDILKATIAGFLEATHNWLQAIERENLLNGARYIILEQAIRFLTDFLEEDVYYPVTYAKQNWVRTGNQLRLLESLEEYILSL